ncbi:MAG: DNA mismatch repair protein [Sandaracinaceae bacterium]|nr:DNA mismatch repair protein [Sandaracinaceae bacterium]
MGRSKNRRRYLIERRKTANLSSLRNAAPIERSRGGPGPMRPPAHDEEWVDLIHHDPLVTIDVELLRSALRFAFESGDAGGLLGRAVDEAPITPSRWDPRAFSGGLFLPELLTSCFAVRIGKKVYEPSRTHLVRLLEHPPDDVRDVTLRQNVLRELSAEPNLRAALERIYVALRELRGLLDERPMSPGETIRRKVEVLTAIKAILDEADEGLAGATSALSRLSSFARAVRERDVYRRLHQVLDFDANMAKLEVRLVLGSEGKIRHFELLRAEENVDNPLVLSPWRRMYSRLVAWLRGYDFTESEVLLRVVDEVFSDLEDVVLPFFDLIGDVELYLAALGFRDRVEQQGLEVCLPHIEDPPALGAPPGPRRIERLFNPLLLLQGITPVACDVVTGGHDSIVLVTGPNSGGKTRMMQAVALTQLLGQSGLFVPARHAALTRAPTMFVSLVEGAPADQKEGRLGTELLRVRELFEQLEPGAMVILDELCSGTNPSEGIAIFNMVVSLLPRLHPQVLVSTHFLDAARELEEAGAVERLELLQVELDASDAPTYQFVPGVAPTSLAHSVASRLGVTHEELVALVERQEARAEARRLPASTESGEMARETA